MLQLLPSTTSFSLRRSILGQEVEEIQEEVQENTSATDDIDYSSYTVAQLKEMLDEKGISYTSSMKKADLIALLEE